MGVIGPNMVSPTAEWRAELNAEGKTWSVTTVPAKGGDLFIHTDVPVNGPAPLGCGYGITEPVFKK